MAKGINLRIREGSSDEVEGKVEVTQGEVREEQADELIDELDMQEDLAAECVISTPDLPEVDKRVDSCEESSVQPSSSLRDKFRDSVCFESVCP